MNAFKIFVLICLLGASQAGATGFAFNMSKAQQMLKIKKEEVITGKKTSKSETTIQSENKMVSERTSFMEKGAEPDTVGEPVSEKVMVTFTQWLSQALMKLLISGFGLY